MIDQFARTIALIGLLLSSIGLILSTVKIFYDWWKDRRRAKVIVDLTKTEDGTMMFVSVVNTGHRPATIEGLGIFFSEGFVLGSGHIYDKDGKVRRVVFADEDSPTDFPVRIKDGEPATLYYNLDTLDNLYAKGMFIKAIVAWDAEGREYKGRIPKYLKKRLQKRPH